MRLVCTDAKRFKCRSLDQTDFNSFNVLPLINVVHDFYRDLEEAVGDKVSGISNLLKP